MGWILKGSYGKESPYHTEQTQKVLEKEKLQKKLDAEKKLFDTISFLKVHLKKNLVVKKSDYLTQEEWDMDSEFAYHHRSLADFNKTVDVRNAEKEKLLKDAQKVKDSDIESFFNLTKGFAYYNDYYSVVMDAVVVGE